MLRKGLLAVFYIFQDGGAKDAEPRRNTQVVALVAYKWIY